MLRKLRLILVVPFLLACGTRNDIVFEAFSDPFLDWYSLKLYSGGEFDLHVPSADYAGQYLVSGDTIFLSGKDSTQHWNFLIDSQTKSIKTIGPNSSPPSFFIDIVVNKLSELGPSGSKHLIR